MASWFRGRRPGHSQLLDIDDEQSDPYVAAVTRSLAVLLNHHEALGDFHRYLSELGTNPGAMYLSNLKMELTDLQNNVTAALKAVKHCRKAQGQTGHGLEYGDDGIVYPDQSGHGYVDWYY